MIHSVAERRVKDIGTEVSQHLRESKPHNVSTFEVGVALHSLGDANPD